MKRTLALLLVCLFPLIDRPAGAVDQDQASSLLVETLAATDDPGVRSSLMRGMLKGLEGRRNVSPPAGWRELSGQLNQSDDARVRDLTAQLDQLFGDSAATQRALDLLGDSSADAAARRTALASLLSQQNAEVTGMLPTLLDESALRVDAIRGYAIVEDSAAVNILLKRYPDFSPEHRRAVVETLATRKSYAGGLLNAVKNSIVARDDIPAHVARSLHGMLGTKFTDVFGPLREVSADREQLIAKYKALITPKSLAAASETRGRAVFAKTCASCHLLYGEGGKIGPDLTGSNRANLDYIVLNSVDPSFDVPDAYKMVQILTTDGRVINGVLSEEDANRVVLKTVEQPLVIVAKEDIETRTISKKSMMPDGQLEQMKPQQVIDLIKYLRTTAQVEMVK